MGTNLVFKMVPKIGTGNANSCPYRFFFQLLFVLVLLQSFFGFICDTGESSTSNPHTIFLFSCLVHNLLVIFIYI